MERARVNYSTRRVTIRWVGDIPPPFMETLRALGYDAHLNAMDIDDTDEAGDAGTADLLTEVSRGIDKQLWFLEAHAQEPSGKFRN